VLPAALVKAWPCTPNRGPEFEARVPDAGVEARAELKPPPAAEAPLPALLLLALKVFACLSFVLPAPGGAGAGVVAAPAAPTPAEARWGGGGGGGGDGAVAGAELRPVGGAEVGRAGLGRWRGAEVGRGVVVAELAGGGAPLLLVPGTEEDEPRKKLGGGARPAEGGDAAVGPLPLGFAEAGRRRGGDAARGRVGEAVSGEEDLEDFGDSAGRPRLVAVLPAKDDQVVWPRPAWLAEEGLGLVPLLADGARTSVRWHAQLCRQAQVPA